MKAPTQSSTKSSKRPTVKQKRVAKALAENYEKEHPLTGAEIVANSGYGPSMSHNPQVVLESNGVREELRKLGFDTESAKSVITEVMNNKEEAGAVRIMAAREVFKVQAAYAPQKHEVKSLTLNADTDLEELATEAAKLLKDKKL